MAETIDKLGDRVIKILIPTEHCAFVEKFIEIQYFGIKKDKVKNRIKNIDYIFSQSDFTKNYLIKKKIR